MKYLIPFLALFISFSSFAQTEHPEQKIVEERAQQFIKLFLIDEYDQAIAMSTPSTAAMLTKVKEERSNSKAEEEEWKKESAEMRKAQVIFKDFDFKETATAEYCMVTFVFSTKPNKNEDFLLKKVDGLWLADLNGKTHEAAADAVTETAEQAVDAAVEALEEAVEVIEAVEEEIEIKED